MPAKDYNEYMKEYMKTYSAKRRQDALDLLGGQCNCGSVVDLEIHHVNPALKSFTISQGWHHSWEKILRELEKCEILCKACHIDHHRASNQHGTTRRYWQGCRCDLCKKAMSVYNKQYIQARKAKRFDSS